MTSRFLVLAAALAVSLLAIPAAQAFTLEGNGTASGGARYVDPDTKLDSGDKRTTTIQQGNASFHFGGATQSFDQRYDANRMFDTLGGPGRDGYR